MKDSSLDCSSAGSKSLSKGKDSNIPENAAVILRKKVPSLKDKELNPEFFQKLETEVVLPRRCLELSHPVGKKEQGSPDDDSRISSNLDGALGHEWNENQGHIDLNYRNTEKRIDTNNNPQDLDYFTRDKWTERGFRSRDLKMRAFDADERVESQKGSLAQHASNSRTDGPVESLGMNNKGNWLAIQRQLLQLERQQAHLMNMLQVCFK